jgi:signal transduction histidine kinase
MVQEVLDYSRGRSQLDLADENLSGVLKELELWNSDYAVKRGVTFSVKPADVTIYVDKDRLLRALQNILSNAIQSFEIEGGTVSVAVTRIRETDVTIEISDDGPGIPEHIREKIFEPFVTHGKHTGTGLGMPIAKTIVEAHGGTLSFISNANKGTTFIVTLPAGKDTGESNSSGRDSTSDGILRG